MKPQEINRTSPEYNRAVQTAYLQIYKEAKALLSTIEQEPLRQIMERECKTMNAIDIVHEMISPLIFLRLERYATNELAIHYGYAACELASQFYPITSAFIRTVYKLTMATTGSINIEGCVRTDWVVVECAEMFEYMLDRNKHHTFSVLKFKPTATRRKQQLQVA
jgi:hypothetical protein